jgi:hypothetical protein
LLNAPIGTKLFKRLSREKRMLSSFTGNNMDGSINFIPKMKYRELIAGYSYILKTIYSQKVYYQRVKKFLHHYELPSWDKKTISIYDIKAFFRLIWLLGTLEKGKKYFWKLLALSLFKYPAKFSLAMTMAVYGYHFRRITATI